MLFSYGHYADCCIEGGYVSTLGVFLNGVLEGDAFKLKDLCLPMRLIYILNINIIIFIEKLSFILIVKSLIKINCKIAFLII